MKKKKVILTGVLALMGVIGYTSLRVNNGGHKFSDLELLNIEALTVVENPLSPPCDNMTGYKKWETSGNGVYNKEHFRDCCYKEKSGYNPTPCI